MPALSKPLRRIDQPRDGSAVGSPLGDASTPAPPVLPTVAAPTDLVVVSTAPYRAAQAPLALANLQWRPPGGVQIDRHLVRWSTSSSFVTAVVLQAPAEGRAGIDGLPAGQTVYFQVAAVAAGGFQSPWSASVSALMPLDLTPPPPPANVAATFLSSGALRITWTKPASESFKSVEIRVWNSTDKEALYETIAEADGTVYEWSAARNRQMSVGSPDGSPDPSVYIELRSRSWTGVFSGAVGVSATLAPPAAPANLSTSWTGDTGLAGAACVITWVALPSVDRYRLTIDGVSRDVLGGRFVYDFDSNRQEHGGAADPQLLISIVAVDALDQVSPPNAQTATNAPPPATTITAFGAFSQVGLTITPSAAADLAEYRVEVWRNSSPVRTIITTDPRSSYTVEDGTGSYGFRVVVVDRFGQQSAASAFSTAVNLTDLSEFVANLRQGLSYRDNLGTNTETLASLKDADVATNAVSYPPGSTWQWTEGDWGEQITHQTSELSTSAPIDLYIGTSIDGITWQWFANGTATGTRWQPAAVASEAAAQAAPAFLGAGNWRVDLPTARRARFVRLGHRRPGAVGYSLREFFPSSLIRGTYVEAESITAAQLAAGSVVAGKIAAGALDAFLITGATIRTAASGPRVEITSSGLRSIDSSGNTVVRMDTTSNGEFWAGNGRIRVGANTGLTHVQNAGGSNSPLDFLRSDASTVIGRINTVQGGIDTVELFAANRLQLRGLNIELIGPVTAGNTFAAPSATISGTLTTNLLSAAGLSMGFGIVPTNSAYLAGHLVVGGTAWNPVQTGSISCGVNSRDYSPTSGTWSLESTLVLTGNNHSVLAFHDSGDRVDFIRVGEGRITIGYNGGFGAANVHVPGNATGFGGTPIGNQRVRINSTADAAGHFPLAIVNNAGTAALLLVEGNSTFAIAGTWGNLSDARLKRDIVPIAGALARVCQWRPVTYRWADGRDDASVHLGFLAQELATVSPDLVRFGPDGYFVANYSEAVAELAAAVQELAARLTTQEE